MTPVLANAKNRRKAQPLAATVARPYTNKYFQNFQAKVQM